MLLLLLLRTTQGGSYRPDLYKYDKEKETGLSTRNGRRYFVFLVSFVLKSRVGGCLFGHYLFFGVTGYS